MASLGYLPRERVLVGPSEFYVVFSNTRGKLFSKLKRGFQHCCIIKVMKDQAVYIDHTARGTEVAIVSSQEARAVLSTKASEDERTVLYNPAHIKVQVNQSALNTCVNRVKAELGIESWAVTPYQLYKHLVKVGFTKI